MEKLKCECCGGTLNKTFDANDIYVCEYCGTKYKIESRNNSFIPIKIETFHNPVQTLSCKTIISDDAVKYLGNEKCSEITMREITSKLAESLAPFLQLNTEYDPCCMQHVITARVRLVEEKYRF